MSPTVSPFDAVRLQRVVRGHAALSIRLQEAYALVVLRGLKYREAAEEAHLSLNYLSRVGAEQGWKRLRMQYLEVTEAARNRLDISLKAKTEIEEGIRAAKAQRQRINMLTATVTRLVRWVTRNVEVREVKDAAGTVVWADEVPKATPRQVQEVLELEAELGRAWEKLGKQNESRLEDKLHRVEASIRFLRTQERSSGVSVAVVPLPPPPVPLPGEKPVIVVNPPDKGEKEKKPE